MKRPIELSDEDFESPEYTSSGMPSDSPSRFPVLARFGLVLAGLVSFLILAVILVPMILPASMTVTKVQDLVGSLLDMELEIRGDHSVRLFPHVKLVAHDIIVQPKGNVAELTAAKVEITASTLSLISSSLDISELLIDQPSLRILPGAAGEDTSVSATDVNRTWGGWRDFQLRKLALSDGRLMLMASGMTDDIRITDIQLDTVSPDTGEALDGIAFDGTANANGESIALHIAASNPQLLVTGNRWPVSGIVTSNFMTLGFNGSMALRERLVGTGSIKVTSADVGALNGWIGTRIPHRPGDTLDVVTPFELSANSLDMQGVNITVGDTDATGMIRFTGLAGGEARLDITISAETIDFGATPISSILVEPQRTLFPQLPGTMTLDWKSASWGELILGAGSVTAERDVGSNALRVSLNRVDALGGILRGEMTIDRSEGMRALHVDGKAVGVAFQDLFQRSDVWAPPLIAGDTAIDLKLFSVGGDADQLFQALSGNARLQVLNGTLGLPVLVDGLAENARDAIDFASLNGTFDIAQGIASSEDLLLRSSDISLVARGNIDLADWTVELDIGQLKSDDGERSLQHYRLFGPVQAVQFEAVN